MSEDILTNWRTQKERSSTTMLKIMVTISLRLGRPMGRLVLIGIALYFLLFSPKAKRASQEYLTSVWGRAATWGEQYQHFFSFASTIHDRIYMLNNHFDLFDIQVTGEQALMQEAREAPGALLIGAHLGSFEVLRAMGKGHANFKVAMLMYPDNARKINAMLDAINPMASKDIVPLGRMDSMLQVRERLDVGCLVGMLADRSLGDNEKITCKFLDRDTLFPLGPWRAAAMMRRPVFLMVGLYMGGSRYSIHFEELADFSKIQRGEREQAIQHFAQAYADRLSFYCRQAPYNWFNFFDFWGSK